VFILSTTKANVGLLGSADAEPSMLYPGESARRIADRLGVSTAPIVVCNACISGLSAIILASRLMATGAYDQAVVCGADVLCPFITSGFESLKAVSPAPCRPFDMERTGMNLGEAAATIVLSKDPMGQTNPWAISTGVIRNDGYDISAPSRTAEGATRALKVALGDMDTDSLAMVNAHGTATMFMDQMESVAITKAGLGDVPVNSLKGYYGHTWGAAGILETVLTMRALDNHIILGTKGFGELGVSGKVRVSASHQSTEKTAFVKLISGFGGGNAALLVEHGDGSHDLVREAIDQENRPRDQHRVQISPTDVTVDGKRIECEGTGKALLTNLYKRYIGDYPRFYKMDLLSRLGFVASELLLASEGKERFVECDGRAVVLFNHSSSIHADRAYLESIRDADNYYPSPSLFVYTLPNIVTGEIAIRNHYHGETSFYILPRRDEAIIRMVQQATFCDPDTRSMMTGWLDCEDEDHFEADLYIIHNA
jgi:3-oxoacyl-[acyl-carrier-protein] synthase-1